MASIRVRIIAAAGLAGVFAAGHPAWAQFGPSDPDLSGSWMPAGFEDFNERAVPGPSPGDFTGLALNAEGKALALSTSVSRFSTIERQCAQWPPQYLVLGPFGMKITGETDPVTGRTIAYHIGAWEDRPATTIWMDGRPHPSDGAPHMRGGFETGKWHGYTLTTHTTHIKAGIIRRNGAQVSDQATLTTHYILQGDILTVLMFIKDPVYLSEPQVFSKDYRLGRTDVQSGTGPPCISTFEGTSSESVAHYLPGTYPFGDEMFKVHGIPREAALGGAETMYPEYRKKLKDGYVRPEKCLKDCGGMPFGGRGGPPGAPPGGPPGRPGGPPPAGNR